MIDEYLNAYIWYLIISCFGAAGLIIILFVWRDKNFAIALIFLDGMTLIIMATWGKNFIFDAFVRITSLEFGVKLGSGLDEQTRNVLLSMSMLPLQDLFAIIGITVTGLFAIIMMLIRHNFEVKKLRKRK